MFSWKIICSCSAEDYWTALNKKLLKFLSRWASEKSENKADEDFRSWCITQRERDFIKSIKKKIKSDFSTVNLRCLCSFKTVWFSEKWSICQSIKKKYDIEEDFNDSDTDMNFEHACLNLSWSFLINENVCLKIEEEAVWDITNLIRMTMRFCRLFVQ